MAVGVPAAPIREEHGGNGNVIAPPSRHFVDLVLPVAGVKAISPSFFWFLVAIPPIDGKLRRTISWAARLIADRAYDADLHRIIFSWRRIEPCFANGGEPHGSGPGKNRRLVDCTISGLHQDNRLRIRYEMHTYIDEAFMILVCVMIDINRLHTMF